MIDRMMRTPIDVDAVADNMAEAETHGTVSIESSVPSIENTSWAFIGSFIGIPLAES